VVTCGYVDHVMMWHWPQWFTLGISLLRRSHMPSHIGLYLRHPTRVWWCHKLGFCHFIFGPFPSSWELVIVLIEALDHVWCVLHSLLGHWHTYWVGELLLGLLIPHVWPHIVVFDHFERGTHVLEGFEGYFVPFLYFSHGFDLGQWFLFMVLS